MPIISHALIPRTLVLAAHGALELLLQELVHAHTYRIEHGLLVERWHHLRFRRIDSSGSSWVECFVHLALAVPARLVAKSGRSSRSLIRHRLGLATVLAPFEFTSLLVEVAHHLSRVLGRPVHAALPLFLLGAFDTLVLVA